MSKTESWVWMPHPGHLIVGYSCRFRLCTYVGTYLVSTVGEYCSGLPREDPNSFDDIGYDRKYETMVFRARKEEDPSCCPWRMADANELDMQGYNDPAEAAGGHVAMCEKWSHKK